MISTGEAFADERYRTAPLAGLWTHQKGGFYHDGRFATLRDVVDHYNQHLALGLTEGERSDLVEHLKSLPAAGAPTGARGRARPPKAGAHPRTAR